MADMRCMNKEFVAEFINIYRSHPALWKVKSKEYANRSLKNTGYDALVKFYRKADPSCDREMVSKKIQSLRGSFRKELHKYEAHNKSSSSGGSRYIPSLWYFDLLMFTKDGDSKSTTVNNNNTVESDNASNVEDPDPDSDASIDLGAAPQEEETSKDSQQIIKTPQKRSRKHLMPDESESPAFIQTSSADLKEDDMKESSAFGNLVATKHIKLNKVQRMYAENIIINVLNMALLGKLTENSVCGLKGSLLPNSVVQPIYSDPISDED